MNPEPENLILASPDPSASGTAKAVVCSALVRPAVPMLEEMATAYASLERVWTNATLDEKRALIKEAQTCSTTNCGWSTYGAAQHILRRANFHA